MKPFTRLRDGEGTEVERLILDSAASDAPSQAARLGTLATLGLSGAVATAATAHAATAALGGGGTKVVSSASGFVLAKWLALGAVVGAATTGSVVVVTTPGLFGRPHPASVREAAPAHAPSRSGGERIVERQAAVALEAPVPAVEPDSRVEGSVQRSRPAPKDEPATGLAPAPKAPVLAVAPGDKVAEEVAALDRARSALGAGDARGALAFLDAYERSYPRGTLTPEATVLRVRALVQLGRRSDAESVVDGFVRTHPGSAQAARLRALVGEPTPR